MMKAPWLLASLLAIGSTAIAQNAPLTGISENTDPNKVAEVERRAQEVQAAAQHQATPVRSGYTGADSAHRKAKPMKHHKMRKGKMHKEPAAEQ